MAAALCAGLAASATGGTETDLEAQLGGLRDAVVTGEPLAAGHRISARVARRSLEVRRIPERFLPPGALTSPAQAIGRSPAVAIAAGGYVLSTELREPRDRSRERPRLSGDRRPVEITVHGAEPLAGSSGPGGAGSRVDVVVTTEAAPGGGSGRTYVAAEAVALLDLRAAGGVDSDDALAGPAGEEWIATLALTRSQALTLIHAQSFARDVRLIAR